jgi:hypothetical protein
VGPHRTIFKELVALPNERWYNLHAVSLLKFIAKLNFHPSQGIYLPFHKKKVLSSNNNTIVITQRLRSRASDYVNIDVMYILLSEKFSILKVFSTQ